jgi:hypothetical protein
MNEKKITVLGWEESILDAIDECSDIGTLMELRAMPRIVESPQSIFEITIKKIE